MSTAKIHGTRSRMDSMYENLIVGIDGRQGGRCGGCRDELLELSKWVDLLVCGSRRQGLLHRLGERSTSDYLARYGATPRLITPSIGSSAVDRWHARRATTTAQPVGQA